MQNDTFPNDLCPSASIGSNGLSFLRTVSDPSREDLGVDGGGRCVLRFSFSVFQVHFLQKLTQALKRSHPKISCRRRDFFAKNVMAVTLGVLHLRKVYNQKPCHKNPSRKKTGSKSSIIPNTFSYKHLQKPLETPTLHLHGGSLPHSPAKCHNLQKIHPSDRAFLYHTTVEEHWTSWKKTHGVSNQKLISGLEKKTQVYRHIKTATFYFMPFSWSISTPRSGWNKSEMLFFFQDVLGDLFLPKLQGADYTQFG